ncbi:hypothetical protein T265_11085 [Opisthorchis viverrini]|uniref:Peptidase A2 domain-containing protein n=1 Tax=Opisthorchis viverrini TaxID=6198 RepID=A0A074ZAS3_OPIVI|nr:hypothetical protein T265_11085 [Opisthorchis viverrini]KER20335.1 hypothetical protein T265_11085 [Opisthorchis viverrini]
MTGGANVQMPMFAINRSAKTLNMDTVVQAEDSSAASSRTHAGYFQINTPGNRKYLTVTVNGHPVRLQLDTWSDITIISEKLWRTLGQPLIRQAARTATSACGGELKLSGRDFAGFTELATFGRSEMRDSQVSLNKESQG